MTVFHSKEKIPFRHSIGIDKEKKATKLAELPVPYARAHLAGEVQYDYLLAQLVCVLDIQLVQRLDVIVDEGDGNEEKVLLAALHQRLDRVLRAGLQPGQRTHLPHGRRNYKEANP